MDRDELDERVRLAATPEPVAVERVVRAALDTDATTHAAWPRAYAALATGLAAVVALGIWWSARQPTPTPGVYRAEVVSDRGPDELAEPVSARVDGVFRAEATPTVAPSRVIRVTADDGTTWILSTMPDDDLLPPGSAIVVGGRERQ
jgi:hypothetical protein